MTSSQGMKIVKEIINIYVCDYLGCHACVRIMYIVKPKKYNHTVLISAVHFVHFLVLATQRIVLYVFCLF